MKKILLLINCLLICCSNIFSESKTIKLTKKIELTND